MASFQMVQLSIVLQPTIKLEQFNLLLVSAGSHNHCVRNGLLDEAFPRVGTANKAFLNSVVIIFVEQHAAERKTDDRVSAFLAICFGSRLAMTDDCFLLMMFFGC